MDLRDKEGRMYHIQVKPGEIGEYVLIPGDPQRSKKIAKYFDNPKLIANNREYITYTGFINDTKISVCSTGIGGPSTAIAIEELVACGAKTIIRVGTCGGIDLNVKTGDLIIPQAAIRMDGTSKEYAPIEFPAVADIDIINALVEASNNLNNEYHVGIIQSKDSFYGQHNPDRMPISEELKMKWEAWKKLGVLSSEMECSTLFTLGSFLHIRTGAILLAILNQERDSHNIDHKTYFDTENSIKTAINAVKILIKKDNSM